MTPTQISESVDICNNMNARHSGQGASGSGAAHKMR